MTEQASIARLWHGFQHLAEGDKDVVLAVAAAVGQFAQETRRAAPGDQGGAFTPGERHAFAAEAGPLGAGQ